MRVFVALEVPQALIPPLIRVQRSVPIGRPVPEENLHLTLGFFDDLSDAVLEDLHLALDGVRLEAVPVRLRGVDLLGGKALRALAAMVEPVPQLTQAHNAVWRAAGKAGILRRRESYIPHISLIRFSKSVLTQNSERLQSALLAMPNLTEGPEIAETVTLFQSELSQEGAVYTRLAHYRLV